MLRRTLFFRCDRLITAVVRVVPTNEAVTLAALSRMLPDDIMEKIADDHGGLKAFLRAYPHLLCMRPMGPKQVITVTRPEFDSESAVLPTELPTKAEPAPRPKNTAPREDIPRDVLDRIQASLSREAAKVGVSALYGGLSSSDRSVLRKAGGILTALRAYPDLFLVSKLGMYAALKGKVTKVEDDAELYVEGGDDDTTEQTAPAPKTQKQTLPKISAQDVLRTPEVQSAAMQHHAMYLVKYLPVHWTIAPKVLDNVPTEAKKVHMVGKTVHLLQHLRAFMDMKSSVGCRFPIMRLKRGVAIPDMGVIRSDEQMEELSHAQCGLSVVLSWTPEGERIDLDRIFAAVPKEVGDKVKSAAQLGRLLRAHTKCLKFAEWRVRFLFFTDEEAVPLLFQVAKMTIPKYWTPLRVMEKYLSTSAREEAAAIGGLLEWLRANKEHFEVTIPYVKKTSNGGPRPELSVRRRHTSYVEITEERVADEVRGALPAERTQVPVSKLLASLPLEILDAVPRFGLMDYLVRVGHPRTKFSVDSQGVYWAKRGVERDDGTSGDCAMEEFQSDEGGTAFSETVGHEVSQNQ